MIVGLQLVMARHLAIRTRGLMPVGGLQQQGA